MRISDWSSDVCSSDLLDRALRDQHAVGAVAREDARTDELTGQQRRVRIREFGAQRRGARRFIDRQIEEIEVADDRIGARSEEHTSELQSLMRISYAVFCLKKKKITTIH